MSIYRKFVDSAAEAAGQQASRSTNHMNQLESETIYQQQQQQRHLMMRQKSCVGGRAPVVRMSPILSSISSNTLSSTPIGSQSPTVTRNDFKRMVPANEFARQTRHHHREESNHHHHHQQQQQHVHFNLNSISSPQTNSAAIHQQQQQAHYQHQHQHHMSSSTQSLATGHYARRPLSNAQDSNSFYQSTGSSTSRCKSSTGNHTNRRRGQPPVTASPVLTRESPVRAKLVAKLNNVFKTDDPVLLEWMQAMRFETELECLTALQARTLAIDDNLAGALSVRNSQVAIQEMRCESDYIIELTDILIDMLPVNFQSIDRFAVEFSNLWALLVRQTEAQTRAKLNTTYTNCQKNLTIINCTPRKSALTSARTLKPLDDLTNKIRLMCLEMANAINQHQQGEGHHHHQQPPMSGGGGGSLIDNGHYEACLRRIKELYGKFVEISIRAECANIVQALDFDFNAAPKRQLGINEATNQLETVASSASLRPTRPFQSSSAQLPLKWALIALWQLTKEDSYICRLLTEMWQTGPSGECITTALASASSSGKPCAAAKRLDYSTTTTTTNHQDVEHQAHIPGLAPLQIRATQQRGGGGESTESSQLNGVGQLATNASQSRLEKPSEICQRFRENQQNLLRQRMSKQGENCPPTRMGALSSAMKSKQQQQQQVRQLSTIELLIDIIISQPNKHERVDMLNFMQTNKLVEVDELDQSVSAALYTSNQYKVAALRILNHLCSNEQAVKTILKCFSTPPPAPLAPAPQNKIIKSIFECYQTAQEHIYQNETMFSALNPRTPRRQRKRARQVLADCQAGDVDEYSDYGSRQTNSVPTSASPIGDGGHQSSDVAAGDSDEGDDAVVKEAIRLLVQLTTPFHKSNQAHDYYTLVGRFSIESLVRYLTNIIKSTSNREMILLSLSALANISFITTEPMRTYGTSRIILDTLRATRARSRDLELRDQTVTILANMVDKNSFDIVSNGALAFLLSCLEACPIRMSNYKLVVAPTAGAAEQQGGQSEYARIHSEASDAYSTIGSRRRFNIDNEPRDRRPIQLGDELLDDLDCVCDSQWQTGQTVHTLSCLARLRPSESAALERIHQKTAVAFARLSADPVVTKLVLKYGGVKQMIDLCQLSNRRNHSETVLIACLVALRKISKIIGSEIFRHYHALDLIELELSQALKVHRGDYASEV